MLKNNSKSNLSLVILAAGMGSRYGGLKQVEPVGPNGEFIIHYSIFDALRAGFNHVYLVIRSETQDSFRQGIGNLIEKNCETSYIFQELQDTPKEIPVPITRKKLWGTAHALWTCRSAINTKFAVINADDYYGIESFQSMAQYLADTDLPDTQFALIGYFIENTLSNNGTVSRALCKINPHGFLSSIQERTDIRKTPDGCSFLDNDGKWISIPLGTIVSMNFWGFTPGIFAELGKNFEEFLSNSNTDLINNEIYLPNVVSNLISTNKKQVQVLPTTTQWFGITHPQDKISVQEAFLKLHRQGIYPQRLWEN